MGRGWETRAGRNLAAQGRRQSPAGVSLRENGGGVSRQGAERTSLRTCTEELMASAKAGGEHGVVCFLQQCMVCLKENDPGEGGRRTIQGSVGRSCQETSLHTRVAKRREDKREPTRDLGKKKKS